MSNETSPPFDIKSNPKGLSFIFKWDMIIKLVMFGVMAWFASGKPGLSQPPEKTDSKLDSTINNIEDHLQQVQTDIAVIKQQLQDLHPEYGSRPSSMYISTNISQNWRKRN